MNAEPKRDNRGGPRIVVSYGKDSPWRCLLCGAAVIHVDDHYAWHMHVDEILAALVFNGDMR